jgi:hypothetical protein
MHGNNPFRSEADAFRFLLGVIAFCVLIVIGSLINVWLGLGVFIVESIVIAWWLFFRGPVTPPLVQASAPHQSGERRILVIANETVVGRALLTEIHQRCEAKPSKVLVVSPALNSHVKHWTNDEHAARAEAERRLEQSLAALHEVGVDASGEIGDDDPLQAIEDALRTFAPDELIISTHPLGRSNWLERGIVTGAHERFVMPITHVIVDLDAEQTG